MVSYTAQYSCEVRASRGWRTGSAARWNGVIASIKRPGAARRMGITTPPTKAAGKIRSEHGHSITGGRKGRRAISLTTWSNRRVDASAPDDGSHRNQWQDSLPMVRHNALFTVETLRHSWW